jgi:large subunit ribosomal protein L23
MAFNFFNKSKKDPKPPKKAVEAVEATEVTSSDAVITAPAGTVLKRYYVSEKSARGFAINQYTFEVDASATKTEVRDAVERGFKVDVLSVNTIKLPTKKVTLGRFVGTKGGIKKAIVTLKEGQSIAQAQP